MADDWGPWIEHDGKGCPLAAGTVCRAIFEGEPGHLSAPTIGTVGANHGYSWDWSLWGQTAPDGYRITRIIKYQVKTPRGMVELKTALADLPETVDA